MPQTFFGDRPNTPTHGARVISQNHQVSLAVVVTSSFDALVRATRQREGGLTGMAHRVIGAWSQSLEEPIVLKPDGLWFQGELGLEVSDEACWWLLPAFMAGVREIRMEEDAWAEDVVRLAQELGMLELGGAALESFRDWLWADGAEGFDVAMSLSFSEVFELLDTGEMSAAMFGAPRAESILAMDASRVALPSAELAAASLRPEFHTALDMFSQGLAYRAFELTDDLVDGARERLEDGGHWTWAEADAILAHPSLRAAIDPWRLARRVMSRMRHGLGVSMLTRLILIYQSEEPFFVKMRQALEHEGAPTVVARAVDLSDERVRERMLEWLAARGPAEPLAWVAMLVRAVDDDAFARSLAALLRERGVLEVRRMIDEEALAQHTSVAYARAMVRAGCAPDTLASLLDHIDVDAAAFVIAELDDFYLVALDRPLDQALMSATNVAIEALVPSLIARRQPGLLQIVGRVLNSRKDPWMRKILIEVCNAIIDADMANDYLVPLVRNRVVGDAAREIALDALARREDALAEAVKFRFSEYFETQDFRDRIKTDRQRLKEKRRGLEASS
jgi:hypothetical protein